MKIVLIDGIQNKHNSMTQLLVDKCLEGIRNKAPSAEISITRLIDTPIEFCIGCKKCGVEDGKSIGTCVLDDPMKNILPELLTADRIIFASPIYDFTVSSLLNRFIERTLPMCTYPKCGWPKQRNKTRKDKKGLILLASDCPAPLNWLMGLTWHPSILLRMVCKSFGCSKTKVVAAGGMCDSSKNRERFERAAFEQGQKLIF